MLETEDEEFRFRILPPNFMHLCNIHTCATHIALVQPRRSSPTFAHVLHSFLLTRCARAMLRISTPTLALLESAAGGAGGPPPPPPPPPPQPPAPAPEPEPNLATLLLSRDVGFGDEPLSLVVAFLAPRDRERLSSTCRGTWRCIPAGLSAADADRVRRDHPLWKAIINIKHGYTVETRLSWAASRGHLARVRELCDWRADIEATDSTGRTPLTWPSYNGNLDVVRELLSRGANANAVGRYGRTSLLLSSLMGHVEVVGALLAAGADKHLANGAGHTAATIAPFHVSGAHAAILALLAAAP